MPENSIFLFVGQLSLCHSSKHNNVLNPVQTRDLTRSDFQRIRYQELGETSTAREGGLKSIELKSVHN